MARTIMMAPQAPRPVAAKPPPAKHPNGKTPPAPHGHKAHGKGHGGLVTALVIVAALAAAGLWYWRGGTTTSDPGEMLQAQMEAAAQGNVAATHAFGGTLTVTRTNGRSSVMADNVPSRACVQVGWRLAKEGTIIVNGTLPTRLSAARLSELCSGDGGATLIWVPEE